MRVQCAFVDTPEVERINDFVSHQQGYLSAYELPEPEMDGDEGGKAGDLDLSNIDPMFEEAARLIVVSPTGVNIAHSTQILHWLQSRWPTDGPT